MKQNLSPQETCTDLLLRTERTLPILSMVNDPLSALRTHTTSTPLTSRAQLLASAKSDPLTVVNHFEFADVFLVGDLVRLLERFETVNDINSRLEELTNDSFAELKEKHELTLLKALCEPDAITASGMHGAAEVFGSLYRKEGLSKDIIKRATQEDMKEAARAFLLERINLGALPQWKKKPDNFTLQLLNFKAEEAYPSGLFLIPAYMTATTTSSRFDSALFRQFIKDLADANAKISLGSNASVHSKKSSFICVDSKDVPFGMFEDTAAMFVPLDEPADYAPTVSLLLMMADNTLGKPSAGLTLTSDFEIDDSEHLRLVQAAMIAAVKGAAKLSK